MDGYYFGQAILVWDAGQYQLAADLLEYGMHYRTWDWQLPFFAGFDYAYFLKDKEKAAKMYMRAGELSGETLFKSLAGRYLQEAGDTQMAIDYLRALEKGARKPAVKKVLNTRILAFEGVRAIEKARDRYIADHGRPPADIDALIKSGYLPSMPIDPYGGRFYLDENHQVRTTSKFAFAGVRHGPGRDFQETIFAWRVKFDDDSADQYLRTEKDLPRQARQKSRGPARTSPSISFPARSSVFSARTAPARAQPSRSSWG